jgi:predicted DNA-binding protein
MVQETDQYEALILGHVAQVGTFPEAMEALLDESPVAMRGMTIRLTEETLEDLDFLSSYLRVSKGSLIRMLITQRLRDGREAIEKAHASRMGHSDE